MFKNTEKSQRNYQMFSFSVSSFFSSFIWAAVRLRSLIVAMLIASWRTLHSHIHRRQSLPCSTSLSLRLFRCISQLLYSQSGALPAVAKSLKSSLGFLFIQVVRKLLPSFSFILSDKYNYKIHFIKGLFKVKKQIQSNLKMVTFSNIHWLNAWFYCIVL